LNNGIILLFYYGKLLLLYNVITERKKLTYLNPTKKFLLLKTGEGKKIKL